MNKQEHIAYWIAITEKDQQVMILLYKNREFVYSLFFAHLILEKYCKALWVKNNVGNVPPKTHNILKLLEESKVEVDNDTKKFIARLSVYQLEGRYPQFKNALYNTTSQEKADYFMNEFEKFKSWLTKLLQ